MSSISELGLHKCDSCGHLIGRGRLTCSHCGAAASIKTELTAGIDFYKIIKEDFEQYYDALVDLFDYSTNVNTFFSGNDITAEIQFENFSDFWREISIRVDGRYGHYSKRREGVRLFRSLIKVSKDVSFFRFIAVDKSILYLCEVNTEARNYLDKKVHKAQQARQKREADRKIKDLNGVLDRYRISLESKQAEKLELEEVIEEWNSKSWMGRLRTACASTKIVSSEIAKLEENIMELNAEIAVREDQRKRI